MNLVPLGNIILALLEPKVVLYYRTLYKHGLHLLPNEKNIIYLQVWCALLP